MATKATTKSGPPPAPPAAEPNGWDAPSVYALNGHLDFADPDD